MFKIEELKQLSDFLLEEFKPVFVTKEELNEKWKTIDQLVISVDNLSKGVEENTQEIKVITHRLKEHDDWIVKAAPKVGVKYNP